MSLLRYNAHARQFTVEVSNAVVFRTFVGLCGCILQSVSELKEKALGLSASLPACNPRHPLVSFCLGGCPCSGNFI